MNGGGLTVAVANSGKGRRFDDGFDLQPSGKVIRVNRPKAIRALMIARPTFSRTTCCRRMRS